MINWPAPPSGTGEEANWFRKLLHACRQLEVLPGPNYRVKQTLSGVTLDISPQAKGGGVSTVQNNDRGLWTPTPTSPYSTYDKVVLQTGTATGYYMSLVDNNINSPDSGIGWIQLGTNQGQWL